METMKQTLKLLMALDLEENERKKLMKLQMLQKKWKKMTKMKIMQKTQGKAKSAKKAKKKKTTTKEGNSPKEETNLSVSVQQEKRECRKKTNEVTNSLKELVDGETRFWGL